MSATKTNLKMCRPKRGVRREGIPEVCWGRGGSPLGVRGIGSKTLIGRVSDDLGKYGQGQRSRPSGDLIPV